MPVSLYKIKKRLQGIWEFFQRKTAKPNKKAVWIFGMQKAGTSAIAGLLAYRADKTVTIDTTFLWQPYLNQIKEGKLDFKKHIHKNALPFSKDIIKEPAASLLIEDIENYFDLERYVFILRDPFDLIRSILNRLNLSGSETSLNINDVDKNWRYMFEDRENYVQKLAEIYREIYSQSKYINNSNCILVKYEDFNNDKEMFINQLCEQLDFQQINSIEHLKNKNFQPKGNPIKDYKAFFGDENYHIIYNITSPLNKIYGYERPKL